LPASSTINSTPAARTANITRAILWGGFLCGVLDITAAFVVYGQFGAKPIRILQSIASGLLGARSFDGGFATAALGLFLHFFIAFSAATVFVVASRRLHFLVEHPIVSGVLYGIAVYFFMQGVVRLSAARHGAFSWKMTLIGVAIHIVCVGTPIAQATYRIARG
jgi:hypothetical protein